MKKLPEWLDLNLPAAPNVDLPPLVLTPDARDRFLMEMHEEAVRTGVYGWPDSSLRQPCREKFVLLD